MKKIVLLLVLLMGVPSARSYDNVTLEFEYPSQVLVGEEIEIAVTLTNTAGNNVWECYVRIDKEGIPDHILQYIDFKVDEAKFKAPLYYKKKGVYGTDQVSLKLRFEKGVRGGTYTIPILFSGRVGECKDGCIPLPPQEKKVKVAVIVPKPFLTLQTNSRIEAKEETVQIPFQLKNTGTGKATNIVVTTSPLDLPAEVELNGTVLEPDNEMEGRITLDTSKLVTGVYTMDISLTYSDENFNDSGRKESVDVIVSNEGPTTTPPPTTEAPRGDIYYAEALQQLSDESYKDAVASFIDAEVEYLRSGNTEKAVESRNHVEEILDTLALEKDRGGTDSFSVIVGLLAGSALSGVGMILWLDSKGF